jgi:hypothetical protein
MKAYIGTKLINAKPMTRSEYNIFRKWELPADEDGDDEGYLVEYCDGGKANTEEYCGYISWSPRDVFNTSYRSIHGLTFGLAVEALKKGLKVDRFGWNGRGMFIYYVPANKYPAVTDIAKEEFGDLVPYNAYLAIRNVNGTVSTWVPSINDVLADDWQII